MAVKKLNESKVYIVQVERKLEKLSETVLFPEKLERANQVLKTTGVPALTNID